MKKLILLLGCLVFAYAQLVIERENDSKYQQEVCGDDYECSAYEDFIPNVDILEAFKQDLQKEIKFPKYDVRALIYRQIITMNLPNDNEILKKTIVITVESGDLDVKIELTRSKNRLVAMYIVEAEESIKTYIKTPNGVKILNKTSML
ncbi:hypothetical protein LS77_010895 [Helicobacter bilis]|uniref:Uncharacterized protein n=2 Tax=Helicobacter bilis TaxID=37372 RepID=A0A6D2C5L7_9HELI|nr:hypothetical protein [Helicobacter bilis]EMZ36915.1 hypothetical protein C826_02313 [Helicobacter bilis WiWa]TLE02360.1 hypothetical protein LS77_010895 [Helicobacter bilis]TLE02989.1 hypothetical protein LS76_010895 [Helicobacter bilis]